MNRLAAQIENSMLEQARIRHGENILVAVSGGVDSMVLLHLLDEVRSGHDWKLCVAHFNHQLRGRNSDGDEQFVKKIAAKLKLKFVAGRGDVKKMARQKKISVEMAARQMRHEFLAKTAKKAGIKTVALAHHADDQVELFLLRLLRGTGTDGLGGMNWQSLSPADPSLHLVRPLLNQTKETLREYALARKIPFREDASNVSPAFLRNRIRHEVIPILKTLQPALDKIILRTMEIAGRDARFISAVAADWLSNQKPPFDQLDMAVQRVCLRWQLWKKGFPSDFDLIEKLRLHPEKAMSVRPEFSVYRNAAGNIRVKKTPKMPIPQDGKKINLTAQDDARFGSTKIHWAFKKQKGDLIQPRRDCEFFDADKVGGEIYLRSWQAGDRFQPIGMKSPIKLQNIFTNLKIPRTQRHRRMVATAADGEIFWVEGLRISERFKLDKESVRRLKWRWQSVEAEVCDCRQP
ncbi:MAG: tRNA lysidine(34) synthetase TilS [Verrucomicrobiota bacterium]